MSIFTLFNLLTKQEQADMLLEEGSYLHSRQEPEFLIDLYRLEDFYVEVYYHKRQNTLVVVKSFYACGKDDEPAHDCVTSMSIAWKNPYSQETTYGCA
jgi:hypothetical protein